MSELGWAGIFIDEEHGGQGLGIVELVILMEELGYALAPVPFLSNAAAGLALQFAGSDEQKERWLPGIASGEARGHGRASLRDGEARLVPDADSAEVIVLIAPDGGDGGRGRSAAEVEPFETHGPHAPLRARARRRRRAAARRLLAGRARPHRRGAVGRDAWAWRRRRWRWRWSTRATASSSAARSAPTRRSRTAARRCCSRWRARARAPTTPPGAPTPSRSRCRRPPRWPRPTPRTPAGACAPSSLQVHGGIGFTWEHDLHFFLKRAKTNALLYGSAREHRERVASLALATARRDGRGLNAQKKRALPKEGPLAAAGGGGAAGI